MRSLIRTSSAFTLASVLSITVVHTFGMFGQPQPAPIDRLLASAEAFRAAHPKSPEAHYTVARIHYLAFAQSSRQIPAFLDPPARGGGIQVDGQGKPRIAESWLLLGGFTGSLEQKAYRLTEQELGGSFPGYHPAHARNFLMIRFAERGRSLQQRWIGPDALSDEAMVRHVIEALSGFWRAIQLEQTHGAEPVPEPPRGPRGGAMAAPRDGLFQLGLASLLEQFADWKSFKPSGIPVEIMPAPSGTAKEGNAFSPIVSVKQLQLVDHREARDAYLIAFRSAFRTDRTLERKPISGLESLVSVEAGHGFLRLAVKDPEASTAGTEVSKAAVEVKAGLAEVAKLPFGAVTPIIFTLSSTTSIEELLAPDAVVAFDLRGYGPAERWPWVKPDTAILVWDPLGAGAITSARQLFGGYTFEIFRKNGYESLAAMDDNRDGVLREQELAGIRAWLDTNSDGRSNSSEVRDLSELGILAIDVRATASEGLHPMNPRGLHLNNGRALPTWDWMAEPLPPLRPRRR